MADEDWRRLGVSPIRHRVRPADTTRYPGSLVGQLADAEGVAGDARLQDAVVFPRFTHERDVDDPRPAFDGRRTRVLARRALHSSASRHP